MLDATAHPASPTDRLDLGVGITTGPGIADIWAAIDDLVDVVEASPAVRSSSWFDRVDRPVVVNGHECPVGGQLEPDPRRVAAFAAAAARTDVAHAVVPVGFDRVISNEVFLDAGTVLPARQTWETIEVAVAQLRDLRRRLTVPLLVRTGTNPFGHRRDELDDGTFVTEIVERSDSGLVLDLASLLANERSGRYPVEQVLRTLPLERVLHVTVAGRNRGACDQTVLSLVATTLPLLPNVRAVTLDLDLGHPTLRAASPATRAAAVRRQLDLLREVVAVAARRPVCHSPRRPTTWIGGGTPVLSEAEWQRQVVAYVTGRDDRTPSDDPGFEVLRSLAGESRASVEPTWMAAEADAFRRWIGVHAPIAS